MSGRDDLDWAGDIWDDDPIGEEAGGRDRLEGRRLRVIRDVDERYVFRFEFGPAILAQVREKLNTLPTQPLGTLTRASAQYPGFYQLFRGGRSVYVGRTIRAIGERLDEHRKRLQGRVPLDEMRAKFLFVEDLSLLALSEHAMISYFHPLGLDEWGKLGFGSKAPGFGRAGQTSEWDARFPPMMRFPVQIDTTGPAVKLFDLIGEIAQRSPIRISIPTKYRERFKEAHAELITPPFSEGPFTDWVEWIETRLAQGWRLRREPMAWYIVDE